jgi:hypothetical protein
MVALVFVAFGFIYVIALAVSILVSPTLADTEVRPTFSEGLAEDAGTEKARS